MPLAFTLLLCCVEVLRQVSSFAKILTAARLLLVSAIVLSSLATFLSGYQASALMGELSEPAEAALGVHHAIGRFVLINSVLLGAFAWLSAVARQRQQLFRGLYVLALVSQLVLVVWVGTLGGELVFSHRIGVKGS